MRSIWKGAISFGLVTIPVKLYGATQENDVSFHQVHREDGGRVRYRRVCSLDGEEVSYADIAKGYELPSGETVVLTDEDFADLPLATSRTIDVLQFVPLEQVDPIYFSRSYYLEPDQSGARPYVLLREALQESGRVALVKVALRQREALGSLRVRDGVFVLEVMLWPDEIRTPDFAFLEEEIEVRPQELTMAASLIETLAGDFDPGQYSDGYREALQALIDAKVAGRDVVAPTEPGPTPGKVVDLMAALRASVEAAKQGRAAEVAAQVPDPAVGLGDDQPPPNGRRPTTTRSAGKSVGKTVGKAAGKTAGKSAVGKAAGKTAGKSAVGKTAGKTAGKSATGKSAGKSAPGRAVSKTAGKTAGKSAAGKSAGKSAPGRAAGKSAARPTGSANGPAKPAKAPVKSTASTPGKAPAEGAARSSGKRTSATTGKRTAGRRTA